MLITIFEFLLSKFVLFFPKTQGFFSHYSETIMGQKKCDYKNSENVKYMRCAEFNRNLSREAV